MDALQVPHRPEKQWAVAGEGELLFIEDVVTGRFPMLHRMAHATYMWAALYGVSGLSKKKKSQIGRGCIEANKGWN